MLRRAYDAAVFCRREGGGEFTHFRFRQDDAVRLVASGELILLGQSGTGLWTRIDAEPAAESERLHRMGLSDEGAAWRDWAEKRVAFDARFRGAMQAVAIGACVQACADRLGRGPRAP